jgi:hypothetical protein
MRFFAREPYQFSNGAVGWRPGGPMDRLGPYAKVQNCPIDGTDLRRTCYAIGYADSFWAIPAWTRVRGRYIGGFFESDGASVHFVPYHRFKERLL